MKTIRRLIHVEVIRAVALVALTFLALFFFFDFVDELRDLNDQAGKGYRLGTALLYLLLQIPSHLYELFPIAVLIGTVFVMARMAQSSEYTILRTSGLGPARALRTLLSLGLLFVAVTFVLGDYITPEANRAAQLIKAPFQGDITIGRTGAWLKERQPSHSYSVNVGAMSAQGVMRNIRIFEFDATGSIAAITRAQQGTIEPDAWQLLQAERSEFHAGRASATPRIERTQRAVLRWPTGLSADMVAAALLSPERMKTVELFQYTQHLKSNSQNAQRYELEFWRKVFYPISCLVMMVLALPFAYMHFRSGNISGYVFIGVMGGISFFLLNNMFGHIGMLHNWEPWMAAAAPGLLFSLISLAVFGRLVLRQ